MRYSRRAVLAVAIRRKGPPEVLEVFEDMPDPRLRRRDDVLVRVRATSVNPIDTYIRGGVVPLPLLPPRILGGDASGSVEAVGPAVRRFRPGDRVFGLRPYLLGHGCYAERTIFRERELAAAPADIGDVELASVPLVGLTAYQALVDLAGLVAGQRLLVHGGSGGVGSFAIQLGRVLGAHVSATTSPKNAALCRELGASEVFDYREGEYRRLRDLDVVFDTIGAYYRESLPLLRRGGHLVSTVMLGDDERVGFLNLLRHVARRASSLLRRPFGGTSVASVRVRPSGAQLTVIAGHLARGAIRPLVGHVLPLREAARAHAQSQSRRSVGKIVLTVP